MGKNGVRIRAQRTRNIPKHLFAALNIFRVAQCFRLC